MSNIEITNLDSFEKFLKSPDNSPNVRHSMAVEHAYEFLNDAEVRHAMVVDDLVELAADETHFSKEEQEEAFAKSRYYADKLNEYREAVKMGDGIVITHLKHHNERVRGDEHRRKFAKYVAFKSYIIRDIEAHKRLAEN